MSRDQFINYIKKWVAIDNEIKRNNENIRSLRENKNNKCPTLTANMGTGGHNVPLVLTDEGFRKLTPRECFNFQGFPKGFKLPRELANSHLYKQAGNAVTVDLIKILAKRIYQVL